MDNSILNKRHDLLSILCVLIMLSPKLIKAQETQDIDVIVLKTGQKHQGKIIEQVLGKNITLVNIAQTDTFVFYLFDIEKLQRKTIAKNNASVVSGTIAINSSDTTTDANNDTKVVAQYTFNDFFSLKEVTCFGLCFSEAHLIGKFDQTIGLGMADKNVLKNKYIPSWNNLVTKEPRLFKVKEAFHKENVYYDIASTDFLNQNLNPDGLINQNNIPFSNINETLKAIVNRLKSTEKKEGIGVVFIIESFDKNRNEAIIYATLFDIKSKTVLFYDRIIGEPQGTGLRNFWAGSIKEILEKIEKKKYKEWKKTAKQN